MKLKIPLMTLPFIGLALVSLIVYLCAPSRYVWGYDLYCGIHYVVSLLAFFILTKKKNFFDFDTIFLLSYFFVFFVYPIFLYPISETYFYVFAYWFNTDVISQSTGLALMGSQMYMLGAAWYHFKHRDEKGKSISEVLYLPANIFHYMTILVFVIFMVGGGYTFYVNVYKEGESIDEISIVSYLSILFMAFYYVSIILEFNKMRFIPQGCSKWEAFNKLLLVFVFVASLVLFSTGTRTTALRMLLSLIGLYALLYRPIGLKMFLLLFFLGVCCMSFIVISRSAEGAFEVNSFVDLFMDLIINNLNSFTAVEYVNNHGYSYGVSMLAYVLKVVPFLQSGFCSLFGLDPDDLRSAMILTVDTLGDEATWGLGTNIIADLYLAFGAPGVIILMYILGYLVHKSEQKAKQGDIYYLLLYTVFISLSVYMVRSEYFYGLSLFVWAFCIINVLRHFAFKEMKVEERIESKL